MYVRFILARIYIYRYTCKKPKPTGDVSTLKKKNPLTSLTTRHRVPRYNVYSKQYTCTGETQNGLCVRNKWARACNTTRGSRWGRIRGGDSVGPEPFQILKKPFEGYEKGNTSCNLGTVFNRWWGGGFFHAFYSGRSIWLVRTCFAPSSCPPAIATGVATQNRFLYRIANGEENGSVRHFVGHVRFRKPLVYKIIRRNFILSAWNTLAST